LLLIFGAIAPAVARANTVWPGLLIAHASLELWYVLAGTLIELLVIRRVFHETWRWSIRATLVANATSSTIGVIAWPAASFGWELLRSLIGVGSFSCFGWVGTAVAASLASAGVEVLILRFVFRKSLNTRAIAAFWLANLVSTGVAVLPVVLEPHRLL
jgi:hypothetical protein